MDIVLIILPILIVGSIGIFVVMRLKHKYNQDTLGKKSSEGAQTLLDSLIPLGTLAGCMLSIILTAIFPLPFLSTFGLGAGIGLLFGYFAYELYSNHETSYSE